MAKVTLQSIADHVGVSRMTVSNAFNRPDQLSTELRERILAAADELGYSGPDPAARALARGRTGAVGLLFKGTLSQAFEDAVASEFLASVADELARHGQALTLLTDAGQEHFLAARDVAVDGALVYVCDLDSPDAAWLRRRGVPLVAVDRAPEDGVPRVNVDDRGGAQLAAQHLLDLGHRRVGIITLQEKSEPGTGQDTGPNPGAAAGPSADYPALQRMLGWCEALDAAGVEPTIAVCQHGWTTSALDAARSLLDRTDRPTALLCYSDAFAIAAARVAHDLGLRVPEDVSIVGFDDSTLAAAANPPLTTIRQDVGRKARTAVTTLLALLAGETPEPVVLPAELVVRESTAPPPA